MLRPSWIAAALLLVPASASAQVNVEALRSDIDSRRTYVAVQASYAGHAGNTNGSVASGAAFAGLNLGRHLAFLKLQGDYAEFNGVATITKAFAHARYDFRILPWLYAEGFVQLEENKFQRLALRQVDGAGLRFGIVQRDAIFLFLGTAWMLDWEKLSDDPPTAFAPWEGPSWVAQRWSSYLSLGGKLGDRVRLANVTYVQPRVNAFRDLRLLNEVSASVDIDKRFSAKVLSQLHYNSTPPYGVKPLDVDTLTSLVLTL
jgi:hypothetical protein